MAEEEKTFGELAADHIYEYSEQHPEYEPQNYNANNNGGYNNYNGGYGNYNNGYNNYYNGYSPNPLTAGEYPSAYDVNNTPDESPVFDNFRANPEYAREQQNLIVSDYMAMQNDNAYEGTYGRDRTSQAFDYLNRANGNNAPENWGDPKADDYLFTSVLPSWKAEKEAQLAESEKMKEPLPQSDEPVFSTNIIPTETEAQKAILTATEDIDRGDYHLMNWLDKAKYMFLPGVNGDENFKVPRAIGPAIMQGLGGASAGATIGSFIAPGAGTAIGAITGAAIVGGASFIQNVFGIEIPILNKLNEGLDIASQAFEKGQGAIGASISESQKQLGDDASLFDILSTSYQLLKDNPELWDLGQFSYEVGADLGIGDVALGVRNGFTNFLNAIAGTNIEEREKGEVSRANSGIGGYAETVEGTRGYASLIETYLPLARELTELYKQQGYEEDRAREYAYDYLAQQIQTYHGTTGLVDDMAASTILDPANVLPYLENTVVGKIADATGNKTLADAAYATRGNLAVDALPMGVQQAVEAIGNKTGNVNLRSTNGLSALFDTYKNNLQFADVDTLSVSQKKIAGIDVDEGTIKRFKIDDKPDGLLGKLVSFYDDKLKKPFSETNDSKALAEQQNVITAMGNSFFDIDMPNDPIALLDITDQLTGRAPITETSPLAGINNSAFLNSVKANFVDMDDGTYNQIRQQILTYKDLQPNRDILDAVSQATGRDPKELIDIASGKTLESLTNPTTGNRYTPEESRAAGGIELSKILSKADLKDADGNPIPTEVIADSISKFSGLSSASYNPTAMKASVMTKLADASQEALFRKYNIKPDRTITRLGNLNKSVQSLFLLNLSPSYLVNNWINNNVTRFVQGVGGDAGVTKTLSERRGLHRAADTDANETMATAISNRKKVGDLIDKSSDVIKGATKDISIAHVLESVFKMGDGEKIETDNAFNIASNQYFSRTWDTNGAIPVMDDALARSLPDGVAGDIYKIIKESANIQEVREKLLIDGYAPNMKGIIDSVADTIPDTNEKAIFLDFFDKNPTITDVFDAELNTTNPKTLDKAFTALEDYLAKDLNKNFASDMSTTLDDITTRVSTEGFPAVGEIFMDVENYYQDLSMSQTKAYDELFESRVRNRIGADEMRDLIEARIKIDHEDFKRCKSYAMTFVAGAMQGLGAFDVDGVKNVIPDVLSYMVANFDLDDKYYRMEHNLMVGLQDGKYDYETYKAKKSELLDTSQKQKIENWKSISNVVEVALRDIAPNNVNAVNKVVDLLNESISAREQLFADNLIDHKQYYDVKDLAKKHQTAHIQNEAREIMKKNIYETTLQAFEAVKELEAANGSLTSKEPSNMSVGDTLRMEFIFEDAKRYGRASQDYLYDKSKGKDINGIPYEEKNRRNKSADNMSFEDFAKQMQEQKHGEGSYDALKQENTVAFKDGYPVTIGTVDIDTLYDEQGMNDLLYPYKKQLAESEAKQNTIGKDITDRESLALNYQGINYSADKLLEMIGEKSTADKRNLIYAMAGNLQDMLTKYLPDNPEASQQVWTVLENYESTRKKKGTKDLSDATNAINQIKELVKISFDNLSEETAGLRSDWNRNQKDYAWLSSQKEGLTEPIKTDKFEPLAQGAIEELPKNRRNINLVASKPYQYGDHLVIAGVYSGEKLIAYQAQGLPKVIEVDGYKYPVLGISPDDSKSLVIRVANKNRTVTPGNPRGPIYTEYAKANIHPCVTGTTPTQTPIGLSSWSVNSFWLRDYIEDMKKIAKDEYSKRVGKSSIMKDLSPEQRVRVMDYVDNKIAQAYNTTRLKSIKYGEMMTEAALLNYSKRYGFDNFLNITSPYLFWTTRSAYNWAKRMIDKPSWYAMYSRIQNLIDKNQKEFFPTRLDGLVGIPMPNMMDGFGEGFYIDPISQLFPFDGFYGIDDYLQKSLHTIDKNTKTKIERMYKNNEVTEEQYLESLQGEGELYEKIYEEMRASDESDTGLTGVVNTYLQPPMLTDWVIKGVQNKQGSISSTPMSQLGSMIAGATQNTMLEGAGQAAQTLLQAPENALRKGVGTVIGKDLSMNPDGSYLDYNVNSKIAYMTITGDITVADAHKAIAEGAGNEIYDKALEQVRFDNANKKQNGALLTEAVQSLAGNKETSLGQLAGTALVSAFGGRTLPEGEEAYRKLQKERQDLINLGDDKKLAQFYSDNPDFSVRYLAYEDNPEKRLHDILVDEVSNAYYGLPEAQQTAASKAFGTDFTLGFLNKDTRDRDSIDDGKLISWIRALNGAVPNIADKNIDVKIPKVGWYADSVEGKVERYKNEKAQKFPGISEVEKGYYELDNAQRSAYLNANPDLKQYWNWKEKVVNADPSLSVYLKDSNVTSKMYNGEFEELTSAIYSNINDWVYRQLDNYITFGAKMSDSALKQLQIAYAQTGTPISFEAWMRSIR